MTRRHLSECVADLKTGGDVSLRTRLVVMSLRTCSWSEDWWCCEPRAVMFTSHVSLAAMIIFTFTSIGNRVTWIELCKEDKECRQPAQQNINR